VPTMRILKALGVLSLVALVWHVVVRQVVADGGEATTRSSDGVQAATEAERRALLEVMSQERLAVGQGLVAVALDLKQPGDERIEAVLAFAELDPGLARKWCLDHLDLRVSRSRLIRDDDASTQRPCRYALARIGIASVSDLLGWVADEERTPEALVDVAWVVEQVLGRQRGRRVVAAWKTSEPGVSRLQAIADRLGD
jgi:hypothetical protein